MLLKRHLMHRALTARPRRPGRIYQHLSASPFQAHLPNFDEALAYDSQPNAFSALDATMAEIALGVVPIFFGAVRGFSILRDKLHLLRHYRKEVKWLRTKVEVQSLCFKSEVHHVIIDILDTHTAQSLITDDDHKYWKDKDLEGQLRRHMGELHPEFHRALEEVKKALMQIEAKLAVFAAPDKTVRSRDHLIP
jgi:hypothetical protein